MDQIIQRFAPVGEVVGYARTSTVEQRAGYEAQIPELEKAGCTTIYQEQISAVARERPQLDAAIKFMRRGDVFIVTKLDRLVRSIVHLMEIVAKLEEKGVTLRILNLGIDTATPTGKLILTVLGGIAQFEREIMKERQRVGIDRAKLEGKYTGRQPTAMAKKKEAMALLADGNSKAKTAKLLGISARSVFRIGKLARIEAQT